MAGNRRNAQVQTGMNKATPTEKHAKEQGTGTDGPVKVPRQVEVTHGSSACQQEEPGAALLFLLPAFIRHMFLVRAEYARRQVYKKAAAVKEGSIAAAIGGG